MTGGDDIARLLPEPPPARPAGRDAAIAAAMRRFDGIAEPAAPQRAQGRIGTGWRPIGALASVILVAVISIPIALRTPTGPIGPGQPPVPHLTGRPQTPASPPVGAGTSVDRPIAQEDRDDRSTAPTGTLVERPARAPAPADKAAADGAQAQAESPTAAFEPLPPPPPAQAPVAQAKMAAPAADEAAIVVSGSRIAPAPRAKRSLAAAPTRETRSEESSDLVVTGTRSRRSGAARRGDWNACTVNDPEQSLRGCKRLIDPTAKGPKGAAAERLSEGLALAWRGDWGGAIAALDQSIALQPRLAFAYLNRGLAQQRQGESARAAADLDLAVRYAPHAARSYYIRSNLRRERGDVRGARADAERAVSLDPRYEAVVE